MHSDLLRLRTDRTHLFPGARLIAEPGTDRDPASPHPASVLRPALVRIEFGDGVEVEAELLQLSGTPLAAEFVLEVPGFRAAAGTDIPARVWSIARVDSTGDEAVIVVGRRLPGI
ncbi:hypothetical protein DFO66_105147 [Brevibacterium sanguinis]|uniref:Uncharacterized protein n=2 Tax=Brevibacterium TaxID=1696 RepID=A0A366IJZ4_9MICO|nr:MULTISPECIES: hypothetical protein [Brevibacterium]RBP65041.1 hypothetical protein DFO66_105147 [Brevibacterium sanguinis]RBP71304.1 hypothetical protein DFO65_106147 [Brevibacterium celere]